MAGTVEVLHQGVNAAKARIALFDFDGTVSMIRAGWEDIMIPMMVEILLDLKTGESEKDLTELVKEFVGRRTGQQTIYQMMELVENIEKRGGAPKPALEYKHMYHDRLMVKIKDRREGLRSGAIAPEQYLVPGTIALLDALKSRGLKLYCASGTDEVFTKEEARLLGLDAYFDGGVYGAQDDYKSFSKEILIQQLVSGMECRGDEILGFGDGYVEIKNVKDAGGVTVGIASDEPDCLVVNDWKRDRLINVGADFIVPNFLNLSELAGLLFPA